MADSKPPNPLPVKPPTQGGSLPLSFNRGPPGTSYGGGGKYYTISSLMSNTIAQKTMYRILVLKNHIHLTLSLNPLSKSTEK